jgi:hypothetical protein
LSYASPPFVFQEGESSNAKVSEMGMNYNTFLYLSAKMTEETYLPL